MSLGADGNRAARIRRHLEPDEHGIIALVDVVHEAGDLEPGRDRIAQRPRGKAPRKLPFDVHRQAGVAGVQPIAVPARRGPHVDRQLDLAARRRRTFGDELRLDPARVGESGGEEECEQDQQPAEHFDSLTSC